MFPTVVPVRFAMARNESPRNPSSTKMFFASSNILVAVLLPLSVRRRMEEGTILVADLPVTICSARLSTVHEAGRETAAHCLRQPYRTPNCRGRDNPAPRCCRSRAARSLCGMSDFYSGKARFCSNKPQVWDGRPIAGDGPPSYHYSNDDMRCRI